MTSARRRQIEQRIGALERQRADVATQIEDIVAALLRALDDAPRSRFVAAVPAESRKPKLPN